MISSFRLDRVEELTPTGREGFSFDYDKAKANLMPATVTYTKPPATEEHVEAIKARVEGARARVFGKVQGPKPEIIVHAAATAIPDNALRSIVLAEESKGKGVATAFLSPADGKIHLIANRLNPSEVEGKVRHEFLHFALRTNEKFQNDYLKLISHFAQTLPLQTLRELRALYGTDPAVILEEWLAKLAETEPQSIVWRRWMVSVKSLLARYFPNVRFSEDEIREFMRAAMERHSK